VAIDADVAVIGSTDHDVHTTEGAAYIYDLSQPDSPTQVTKLQASDATFNDFAYFGGSVDVSDDTVIVGASGDDVYTGAAYLYDASNGQELAILTASDAASGAQYGYSVGISGAKAIVGANEFDDANNLEAGAAYVIEAGDPADLNNDGVLNILDLIEFQNLFKSGSPTADWNDDGVLDVLDFLAYLDDFQN